MDLLLGRSCRGLQRQLSPLRHCRMFLLTSSLSPRRHMSRTPLTIPLYDSIIAATVSPATDLRYHGRSSYSIHGHRGATIAHLAQLRLKLMRSRPPLSPHSVY